MPFMRRTCSLCGQHKAAWISPKDVGKVFQQEVQRQEANATYSHYVTVYETNSPQDLKPRGDSELNEKLHNYLKSKKEEYDAK